MKNSKGKLVNFNINIEATTEEEAFRNSPAEYESMLSSLYHLVQVMIVKNVNPKEKKKVKHTRTGFSYGVVAILALISKDNDSNAIATTAGIVNELVNTAPNEASLQNFASVATDIVSGIKIGTSGQKLSKKVKDVEVKVMRSIDGKLQDSSMNDLPQHIKDEIIKVLGEQKNVK